MSTIERERRVEFNDGMDELPSLDEDVGDLCDMLEGGDPRTAAILRRRYQRKGLLNKPLNKPLPQQPLPQQPQPQLPQPQLQLQPEKPKLEIRAPTVPPTPKMATSPVRAEKERKSWADMSTESEGEDAPVSFASDGDEAQGLGLAWDPLGQGQVDETPSTPNFWLKVWQKMTGKDVSELVEAQEKQNQVAPAPAPADVEEASPSSPMHASPPSPMQAAGPPVTSSGYSPVTAAEMPTMAIPAGVVPVIPVQQMPMMMIMAKPMPLAQISFQHDSFQRDSFQQDSFQRDSFQHDSFQRESFQRESFQRDSFQRESLQQHEKLPRECFQSLPRELDAPGPRFHPKTAQLGHLSQDSRTFTKTKSKGRLSIASTDSLYSCGVARYWVQFLSGELSNADGVGIVFSSQLPCPQNIQRIISIFANRTGRICMRADADVERSHVNIKAMELGDWLEVVCDFDERKVTFSVWPTEGNVSTATVDFSGRSDRFQRLSAQVPQAASGYLAVVMKHPNLTVTLGA